MGCLILSITRSYMMHPPRLWIVYSMEKSNTLSISWRVLKSNIWSIWFNSCVRSTTSLRFWGSEIEDEYSDLLFCQYSRRLSFTGLISLDLYLYMSKLYLYFLRLFKENFFSRHDQLADSLVLAGESQLVPLPPGKLFTLKFSGKKVIFLEFYFLVLFLLFFNGQTILIQSS